MEIEFKLFGIPIHVSALFLLTGFILGRGGADTPLLMAAWLAVMFIGVLLHELGHALSARAFAQEPAISLHGFGGVTTWQPRGDVGPGKRALITLAGPMVGILIGLPVWVLGALVTGDGTFANRVVGFIVWINLGWAVLNLVPMLPLDGGRIMASLLEMAFGPRSIRAAYVVSIVVAALFGLLMLLLGAWITIVFCAYFVYLNVMALRELDRPLPPAVEP